MLSTALLKTPKILSLTALQAEPLTPAIFRWRQQMLLIEAAKNDGVKASMQAVPASQNLQWVESCLRHSPIEAVRLDLALGELTIKRWATVCANTNKPAFVHLPTATFLPKGRAPVTWMLKRVVDWVAAASLLVALSPLLLLLTGLVYLDSPGPIFFRQWRVGRRGRLFGILKFRTMRPDAERLHHQLMTGQSGMHKLENDPRVTTVGRWLRKYSLDELPQLWNVLRGEMSLVGPRPLALYDALRLSSAVSRRLNALPGMTGFWQVQTRSHQRDLDVVSKTDLDYLKTWSPAKDLRIVLMTIPKVLSGFGAF